MIFCFVQEELRELQEEPTDPQAQQEIINSIEEVYFSNDSFDIVKYELEVSCHLKRIHGWRNEKWRPRVCLFQWAIFCFLDVSLYNIIFPVSSCGCMELLV